MNKDFLKTIHTLQSSLDIYGFKEIHYGSDPLQRIEEEVRMHFFSQGALNSRLLRF